MRKSIRKFLRLINYFVLAGLLLSHAATELSPARNAWLPFFGMAYPFWVLTNVFFVGYWIWRRHSTFVVSLVFLVLNASYLANYFGTNWLPKSDEHPQGFKLLSYNVRLFDLYRWSGDRFMGSKTINFVLGEAPDVVFFQEYFSRDTDQTAPTFRLRNDLGLQHYRTQHNPWKRRDIGLAIFSRYPIVASHYLESYGRRYALWTDIVYQTDTVRLVNVHLSSLHFGAEQYRYFDSLPYTDNQQRQRGARIIVAKLQRAFERRAGQADTLLQFVHQSPYPVVLGGDFNDTPSSYAYYRLRHALHDAFVDNSWGLGASYQRLNMPFRIDYLLHHPRIRSNTWQVHPVNFSDHRPISAHFALH